MSCSKQVRVHNAIVDALGRMPAAKSTPRVIIHQVLKGLKEHSQQLGLGKGEAKQTFKHSCDSVGSNCGK